MRRREFRATDRLAWKRLIRLLRRVRATIPGLSRPAPVRFFVVGAGRGGTSLLAALLDAHPDLRVGFEFESVSCLKGEAMSIDEREARATIARDRLRVFAERCGLEAGRYRRRLWGNKITTEQIAGLEDHNRANPDRPLDVLQLLFREQFPDTKVVFILRDGRTCVRSKVRRTGQSVEVACERWRYSVQVLEYLRTCESDLHELKYEDLVADPDVVLCRVCQFLGVTVHPGMLKGTASSRLRPEYRLPEVRQGDTGLGGVPEGCEAALEPELRALGYL